MANTNPFVVVLTGGIAAGKTAVSDLFAGRDVPVIDTDQIAHEIVEPGQPALKQIAEAFGPEFFGADGRLDRRKMRNAIFSNPQHKARLEGILHRQSWPKPTAALHKPKRPGASWLCHC